MTRSLDSTGTQDPRNAGVQWATTLDWRVGSPGEEVEVSTLNNQFADIVAGINSLGDTVERRPNIYAVAIHDLGDPEYDLVQPLSIVIEEYGQDEGAIARCLELEVFGEGATLPEALRELKNAILDLYDELLEADLSTLGELPLAWRRILNKVVIKVPT